MIVLLVCGRASADAYVPVSSSLLLQGRSKEGLLTLYSGYRNDSLIDAEAMVWAGAAIGGNSNADVLTVNVGLKEPHGLGQLRVGRMVVSTGAIRPVHIDGLRVVGNMPQGAGVDAFAGVPLVSTIQGYGLDWIAGGRASQRLDAADIEFGVSYVHQRDAGTIANEEVGVDFATRPWKALTVLGVASWDVNLSGLAAATLRTQLQLASWLVQAYAERRVAARLLQATSLFSVISDSAASEVGTDLSCQWFPRLLVGTRAAVQWIDVDEDTVLGYRLSGRTRLDLDDEGTGHLLLEVSRRGGLAAGYSGVYLAAEKDLMTNLYGHASGELVAADAPADTGSVWPYVNVGMRYEFTQSWDVATALIARATPQYQHESTLFVRLNYHEVLSP